MRPTAVRRTRGCGCLLFARNFFKHPISLGTLLPSSRFVVQRIVENVPWESARVLVEYGPGIGTFTSEILRRMRSDAVLLAIEINGEFVRFLRHHHADHRLRVVQGSALSVREMLHQQGCEEADCVVAGIPFSTMPSAERRSIVAETHATLGVGGRLMLYQVSGSILPQLCSTFRCVRSEFEPRNLVPLRLYCCTK